MLGKEKEGVILVTMMTYIQLNKRNRERGDEKDEKGNIKIGESEVFRYSYKKRNT